MLSGRKCPDTKYELSYAVCKGRQRVSYPNCKICKCRDGADKDDEKVEIDLKLNIFKHYGIRGVFPDEINEHVTQRIGAAFARFIKEKNPNVKNIVVGRDMRLSSDALAKALINGIISTGVNIVDIGLVSTEITYFAVGYYGFDAGVMVTASRNSERYNGLKFCMDKAIPISFDTGLSEISKIVHNSVLQSSGKSGRIYEKNVFDDYKAYVLRFIKKQLRPLRIVIDAGNGMAGKVIPIVFDKIVCEIIPLFFKLDGKFPNHEPDPLNPENMVKLQQKVVEKKAHFGVAFDGDADRCVFVDERGAIIGGDIVIAMIAKEFLANEKGASVVYDLRSSKIVHEEILGAGGVPVRGRVGHTYIKACMRNKNAVFGGELSGSYYYRDSFFSDSGIITLMQIMNILNKHNISMSKITDSFKKYFSSGEINFDVDGDDSKLEQLAGMFSDGKIDSLDGLTVEYDDWWFNIRKSNTERVLRLNIEAKTRQLLQEKIKNVTELIRKSN